MNEYSVLMSVYYREKPGYLRESIESIFNQTVQTDDFVLVCDGPLTDGLNAVIDEFQLKYQNDFHVIRLEKNSGLGNALNYGLGYCRHELIARMDSDDIAREDRCEKQLQVFEEHSDISIVSGIVEEFSDTPSHIEARRVVPETNEEIIQFAKSRNPFNHPCVMYKKTAVEDVGSYQDFYLLEDYYLWLRMLLKGYRGYNLQEPLLFMRAGSDMYKRRAGWRYVKSQIQLFEFMKKKGYINKFQCIKYSIIRLTASILPNWMRKKIFKKFLRNR